MAGIPYWFRSKRRTLAAFWVIQGVGLYAAITPATWMFNVRGGDQSIAYALIPAGCVVVLTILQSVFFMPIRPPGKGRSPRPLWPSILVGGFLVGALAFAAAMAVAQVLSKDVFQNDPPFLLIAASVMAGSWLFATPILFAFSRRGPRETFVQRLAAQLLLGTIVEAAAIIPLDVFIRRRDDCFCAAGTYIGLTICGAVGLFVLGPAVFLPLLMRRRKRWFAGRCDVCGYDMAGCRDALNCPECGAGWRTPAAGNPAQNDQASSAK